MEKVFLKKGRVLLFYFLLTLISIVIIINLFRSKSGPAISPYPNGKNFAFTITADPDGNNLENDKIIYDFFSEIGLRTTVAVWVKEPNLPNGVAVTAIEKVVNGQVVESISFANGYSQNNSNTITIDFSPAQTTVNAFGEVLVIDSDASSIIVGGFEVESAQQDAYYDNISYTTGDAAVFSDNFSTDTTAEYSIADLWTPGIGSFVYDAVGERAQVITGNNVAKEFSQDLPASASGTFSIDFLPTTKRDNWGLVRVSLVQDALNYYSICNSDGPGPCGEIKLGHGDSCERVDYLQYMQELQKRGFEISLHTVSSGNDFRKDTIEGYERFKDYFGAYPTINIMHSTNMENVYWGKKVVDNGLLRYLIGLFADRADIHYAGEELQSQYFWGDVLKQKTKYVRLWGTSDINTLKFNPSMPYHNSKKPYVNFWFSFSDGSNVEFFNQLLSEENVKQLIIERGASIVYVHFSRFVNNGRLNATFKRRIKILSQQNDGWFVPATTLLDRLLLMKKVILEINKNTLFVTNYNGCNVNDITVLVNPNEVLYNSIGAKIEANEEGEIVLKSLRPGETYILLRDQKNFKSPNEYPTALEKINMLYQRALVYIKHNW